MGFEGQAPILKGVGNEEGRPEMRQIVDKSGKLGCADYVCMDRHRLVVRTPVQDCRAELLMLIDAEIDIRAKHVAGQRLASPNLDIDDGLTHIRD
jgi:hypothetical protein